MCKKVKKGSLMEDNRISKYYLSFKEKYKDRITDVPSIDDVASFYLKNKDNVNFLDVENGVYTFLTDLEKDSHPPIGEMCDDGYYYVDRDELLRDFPRGYITIPEIENRNFILFERKKEVPSFYPDQCKLWINTNLENCFGLAVELASFINKYHSVMSKDGEEAKTCYKISTLYKRNDTITIYTNYMEIDSIISFLTVLKQKQPQLFESDRRPNPLIPKIDGFLSYADVTHSFSAPGLIAEMCQHVARYGEQIESIQQEKQHDFVKGLIIDRILQRTDYSFYPNDSLLDTSNFCSTRLNDVPYSKITIEEGEAQHQILKNELLDIRAKVFEANSTEKQK